MTREEAIERLKTDIYKYADFTENPNENEFWMAFDLAIKALEQEPILDKIRAEIIQSIQNGTLKIESGNEELFNILDKYKTESETQ